MDHNTATAGSPTDSVDKEVGNLNSQHIETIRTISRVPGNNHYYEKDGLRTYGDGEDHDHEPPVNRSRYSYMKMYY